MVMQYCRTFQAHCEPSPRPLDYYEVLIVISARHSRLFKAAQVHIVCSCYYTTSVLYL